MASADVAPRSLRGRWLAFGQRVLAAWTVVLVLGTAAAPAATRGDLDAAELAALRSELAAVLADDDAERDRFDAEVWLHAKDAALSRLMPDTDERLALLGLVWHEAHRHAIDPELALAVIEVESTFDRFAVSSAGAQGLMQVMPFWKKELGRDDDNLTDARTNVRYGMTILAHYLDRESGDAVRALTRYHGNRRDLSYPERVYRAWNRSWRTTSRGEARNLMTSCYAARLKTCDPE